MFNLLSGTLWPTPGVNKLQYTFTRPGRVAQSVGHLTRKSGVLGSIPVWQHTFVSPSAFSRRAVVSYWQKYVHEVLVNRLGGLSLPRKSVVRLTDRPDMTLNIYRGRKTTMQQMQHLSKPYLECHSEVTWPRGYKTFFMLNSVEHEILNAHKCDSIKKFGCF